MKSLTTSDFWKAYAALISRNETASSKSLSALEREPFPSIVALQKGGQKHKVSSDYGRHRALALKKGDDYYWLWIGSHDEYDALLN